VLSLAPAASFEGYSTQQPPLMGVCLGPGQWPFVSGVCLPVPWGDEWLGDARNEKEWRDTNARVEGPVVAQLQQAFAENWQEATGELLPASDFPGLDTSVPGLSAAGDGWAAFVASTANPELTRAERLTQLMVRAARKRLWIAQAYFTPNDALTELLVDRARGGVDVRVLAPGDKNDHRWTCNTRARSRPSRTRAAGRARAHRTRLREGLSPGG
jgi:cardiolipin synthase A/B